MGRKSDTSQQNLLMLIGAVVGLLPAFLLAPFVESTLNAIFSPLLANPDNGETATASSATGPSTTDVADAQATEPTNDSVVSTPPKTETPPDLAGRINWVSATTSDGRFSFLFPQNPNPVQINQDSKFGPVQLEVSKANRERLFFNATISTYPSAVLQNYSTPASFLKSRADGLMAQHEGAVRRRYSQSTSRGNVSCRMTYRFPAGVTANGDQHEAGYIEYRAFLRENVVYQFFVSVVEPPGAPGVPQTKATIEYFLNSAKDNSGPGARSSRQSGSASGSNQMVQRDFAKECIANDTVGDCRILKGPSIEVFVPPGDHNMAFQSCRAPRLLVPVKGDFEFKVKVTADLTVGKSFDGKHGNFVGAGLLLFASDKHYLRLERNAFRSDACYMPLQEHWVNNKRVGPPSPTGIKQSFFNEPHTWFRLTRKGRFVRAAWSSDGNNWRSNPPIVHPIPDSIQLGILAVNTTDREFHATFSDFSLTTEQ